MTGMKQVNIWDKAYVEMMLDKVLVQSDPRIDKMPEMFSILNVLNGVWAMLSKFGVSFDVKVFVID